MQTLVPLIRHALTQPELFDELAANDVATIERAARERAEAIERERVAAAGACDEVNHRSKK